MAAFEAAIALGVDGIETDIRLSLDQQLILFHDRLAPNGQDVATVTHKDLSQQVGYWVPTLADALQLFLPNPATFTWNLELKTPAALPLTLNVLRQYQDSRSILVTSFWHPLVLQVSCCLSVEGGLLVAHRPVTASECPPWPWLGNTPTIGTIVYSYDILDSSLIAQTQTWGLRVFVYGAITHQDHEQLMRWSVDGVITDRPDFLLAN